MTIDELKQTHELTRTIEGTESKLAAYRDAGEVIVGIKGNNRLMPGAGTIVYETTLSAAEIGDQIVRALERRIASMRTELRELGVE